MRLVEVPVGVGRADEPVPAPRDDEQHAFLGAQQQPELRLEAIARNNEVDALGRPHLELAALAHHGLGVIRPHARRVHDLAGADLEVLVRLEIVALTPTTRSPTFRNPSTRHPAGDVRAVEGCGSRERAERIARRRPGHPSR